MAELNAEQKKEAIKKMFLIMTPICLLIGAYFLFFEKNFNGSEANASDTTISNTSSSLPIPTANLDSVNNLASEKIDVYQKEAQEEANSSSINDLVRENEAREKIINLSDNQRGKKVNEKPVETTNNDLDVFMNPNKTIKQKNVVNSSSNRNTSNSNYVVKNTKPKTIKSSTKQSVNDDEEGGFYSIHNSNTTTRSGGGPSKSISSPLENSEEISAVVHGEQKIVSGSTIRLRITQDCIINGVNVPKNTSVSGICSFGGERTNIVITSIKLPTNTIRCKLIAYDQDGIAGLYMPASENQQIGQGAASSGASTAGRGLTVSVPMIGSISTGALQKKVQSPSVKIISGFKITLMQSN